MKLMKQENIVCCVWPGIALPLGKNGDDLVDYFEQNYGVHVEYLEQVKTFSVRGMKGGRVDQIFNVKEDSVADFANIKSGIGALYAKEIVQRKEHYKYIERVYLRYFKQLENEVVKEGDLSKEDVYQTLF
ncbi:hypothetical protein [Virgibacillus sp. CBA3643]|uniref:hypothetical protein n=1 Tax=Virgibacillus sp. CBA3643 TaxID=2942278 RepID=UPI0035A36B05